MILIATNFHFMKNVLFINVLLVKLDDGNSVFFVTFVEKVVVRSIDAIYCFEGMAF